MADMIPSRNTNDGNTSVLCRQNPKLTRVMLMETNFQKSGFSKSRREVLLVATVARFVGLVGDGAKVKLTG